MPASVPITTAAPKQTPPPVSPASTDGTLSFDSFASSVMPVMTGLVGAFSNGAAVDETWSSFTNASSYDIATDTVLNSGGWGDLKSEQIDQVSDQVANFMIKTSMSVNVEEIKAQARQVLESMEPPFDEATIAELLEGPKGLFSGNPGSLNYVDPTTGMNKIDTLLASFGEKYKDVLVQINSGSVKSEDEAKGLIASFSKEMSGHMKENFFGDSRGNGRLGLALEERGEYLQAKNDDKKNHFEADTEISTSLDEDNPDNQSSVGALLNV